VKLFPSVEFCLFEALNDMTNYQRTYSIGEARVEGSCIFHKTEYRERRDHYNALRLHAAGRWIRHVAPTHLSASTTGCHDPECRSRRGLTKQLAHGWNPVRAHQINLDLAPGAEETFAFVLGLTWTRGDRKNSPPPAHETSRSATAARAEKFAGRTSVAAAFGCCGKIWDRPARRDPGEIRRM